MFQGIWSKEVQSLSLLLSCWTFCTPWIFSCRVWLLLGALIRTHILQNADYAYNTCHDSTHVTNVNVIILLIVSIFRSLTDTHTHIQTNSHTTLVLGKLGSMFWTHLLVISSLAKRRAELLWETAATMTWGWAASASHCRTSKGRLSVVGEVRGQKLQDFPVAFHLRDHEYPNVQGHGSNMDKSEAVPWNSHEGPWLMFRCFAKHIHS